MHTTLYAARNFTESHTYGCDSSPSRAGWEPHKTRHSETRSRLNLSLLMNRQKQTFKTVWVPFHYVIFSGIPGVLFDMNQFY